MKWRSLEEFTPGTDTRSLGDIYAERKALIARYVPPETQAVHARAISELKAKRFAENVPGAGSQAPAFELKDHNGTLLSSTDLLRQGRLVICFFRGRWCPFCVGQLEAVNLLTPQIEQEGAALVAISPQTVQQSFFMVDQHKLRFPLLSDAGNWVARQFGLVYRVPDDQQAIYPSRMATTVGNCLFRLRLSLSATARFSIHWPTKTTPSGRSQGKSCNN